MRIVPVFSGPGRTAYYIRKEQTSVKKKILSIALAVALLITLVPMVAVDAAAASEFDVSEDGIAIIKNWEGFGAKPWWDYSQWSVGYGTKVPDGKLVKFDAKHELYSSHDEVLGDYVNKVIDFLSEE